MAKRKVIVPESIHPVGLEILRREVEVINLAEQRGQPLRDYVAEAHGIIVRVAKIDREMLEQAKNLMIIAKHGVGYDNIDIETATGKRVVVVSTPLDNAESVAEHNLGLMLTLTKNIALADRDLRAGIKAPREKYTGIEMKDKTLGLIGLGRIGSDLAQKCQAAFNMNILVYDPYVSTERARELNFSKIEKLDDLLRAADYVAICVPLTRETANLIGAKEMGLMKPDAILVNSSRGGIVDEAALYDSLMKHKITGAAMDVYVKEPPPADHPLLSLDNFVGTPHIAGTTREAMQRMATTCAEEILRVFHGERPRFPLNPQVLE